MRNKICIAALIMAAAMLAGCSAGESSVPTESVTESTTAATATESTTAATTESTTAATTTESTTAATTESTTAATTESTTAATTTESTTAATTESTTAATTESTTAATESTTAATAATVQTESEPEEDEMQEEKLIALTFDDGPNDTTTMEVLDKLEKYEIPATFFLIGNNINDESAKSVKRAYDMGCEIENHSKSHLYMDKLTAEEVSEEFNYVDEKVFEITGEHTKFFRPPYISVSKTMTDTIETPFIAGYGANDWDDRIPADRRAKMVIKQAKDGAIILLHDAQGNTPTVEALDIIIPELQAQGYRFVRLDELFESSGVEVKDNFIYSCVYQTTIYG